MKEEDLIAFQRAFDRSDASRFRMLKQAIRSGSSMAIVKATRLTIEQMALNECPREALAADGVTSEAVLVMAAAYMDDRRFEESIKPAVREASAERNPDRSRMLWRRIEDARRAYARPSENGRMLEPERTSPLMR